MPNLYSSALRSLRNRLGASSVKGDSVVRSAVENLEGRQMFAVTMNAAGFTVVTPGANDRVVYVSSSGRDTNSGFSPSAPVKTISRGESLVRAGTGDQLLFKRGETFYGTFGNWTKGGRSASEPLVIGAYGSGARPVIATGRATAMTTGTASKRIVNHLVIQGLRFYAHQRDPASGSFAGGYGGGEGLRMLAGTNNLLLEDLSVDSYITNINVAGFSGAVSNVRIRRCTLIDAYNPSGHSQGLYAEKVNGLTLEENILDSNGWNTSVSGAGKTMYNHNAYIKESVSNFVARGNVFSNASNYGMQARAGGIIENNTFLNNPSHLSFGLVNGGVVRAGGVTGRVSNNLFQGGGTLGGTNRGWGVQVSNIQSATISGNVFTNVPSNSGFAIALGPNQNISNSSVGINNLTIERNVINNWTSPIQIAEEMVPGGSGNTGLRNIVIRNNDIQQTQKLTVLTVGRDFSSSQIKLSGNDYHSSVGAALVNVGGPAQKWSAWAPGRDFGSAERRVSYSNGSASIESYAGAIGLGRSGNSFISSARNLSASNWRSSLVGSAAANYVRSGFGVGGTTSASAIPTAPSSPPLSVDSGSTGGTISGSTVQLRATADAYVRDGAYAGTNYGNATSLQVARSNVGGQSRWTYLKFNLSSIKSISSATLYLNGAAVGSGSMPMVVNAGSSNSWSENTINWRNKPSKGSTVATFSPTVNGASAKNYAASITSWLKAQKAAGKTEVTLVVSGPTASSTFGNFKSDEASSSKPFLKITT